LEGKHASLTFTQQKKQFTQQKFTYRL